MAYNQEIDEGIRTVAAHWPNSAAKKMFGGICHLLNGHMVCGVYQDYLVLRLGEEQARSALQKPHVRPFDITGRPMKGWVMVSREGFARTADLAAWLARAKAFVETLPPKT